jgi:hypothetical protein
MSEQDDDTIGEIKKNRRKNQDRVMMPRYDNTNENIITNPKLMFKITKNILD